MSEAHLPSLAPPLVLAVTFALVISALVYFRGWLRLRNGLPNLISAYRLSAFMAGLFSVWVAIGSPLAPLDHQSLTIHMVKHLLLMTVAAPLILAGARGLVLWRGLPARSIQSDLLFANSAVGRLERPRLVVLCWMAGTATVIGWHLPSAFQLGMRSQWVHSVEDVCFLLAGLLFWWPVALAGVTKSPRWSIALYLFLATLPCDVLSAFLVFCNRLVYAHYLSTTQLFGMSPLQDQESAGALMWVWVTFAYLIPAVVVTMRMLSPSNEQSPKPEQAEWATVAVRSTNATEAEVL
jgi:cytochrome c oxidase assembly factor CtaG